MPMQRHRHIRLKLLSVQGREDADIVGAAGGGAYNTIVGVDHFVELADDEGHGLDAFDFFLGADELFVCVCVCVCVYVCVCMCVCIGKEE